MFPSLPSLHGRSRCHLPCDRDGVRANEQSSEAPRAKEKHHRRRGSVRGPCSLFFFLSLFFSILSRSRERKKNDLEFCALTHPPTLILPENRLLQAANARPVFTSVSFSFAFLGQRERVGEANELISVDGVGEKKKKNIDDER